jgi:hypothetical protein
MILGTIMYILYELKIQCLGLSFSLNSPAAIEEGMEGGGGEGDRSSGVL